MATATYGVSLEPLPLPAWVRTHDQFLKWLETADIPEEWRVSFINGRIWVDTLSERAFAHNRIKTLIAGVIDPLVRAERLGVFFGDGMTFTSIPGGFTSVPDGMFITQATLDAGRVWLTGAKPDEEDTQLRGVPDLVIEVVSDHSADKDTAWLMSGYWNAGVPEYWLIDARKPPLRFTLYRRRAKGYVAARKTDGWARSDVFGRAFRFVPGGTTLGKQEYQLEVPAPTR